MMTESPSLPQLYLTLAVVVILRSPLPVIFTTPALLLSRKLFHCYCIASIHLYVIWILYLNSSLPGAF